MNTPAEAPKESRLPAIWHVDDDLWSKVEPLLPEPKPKKKSGRPRVADRRALDGILHILRSGCPWKHVSKEFGSGSTCHLRFSQWVKAGVFAKLWVALLEHYDDLAGIEWDWQSIDSAMGKARGIPKKGPLPKQPERTPPIVQSQAQNETCLWTGRVFRYRRRSAAPTDPI